MEVIRLWLPYAQSYKTPRRNKFRYFNPLHDLKDECKWIIRSQNPKKLLGPIVCRFTFEIAMPKNWTKKNKEMKRDKPCLKKIDLDNLEKFANDVIKGIVIDDDSQIWHLTSKKIWAENNRTTIELWKDTDSNH